MKSLRAAALIAVTCLLPGCSARLLEDVVDVGEFDSPRPCNEPTKLFNTFSMHAKQVAWIANSGALTDTLTVNLAIANDKNWPIALSNSAHGVLYSINVLLRSEQGSSFAAKEARGVFSIPQAKEFREPRRTSRFEKPVRSRRQSRGEENLRDVNFRIRPGSPEEATLVFQVPRGRYLLLVERTFNGKPVSDRAKDHIAVCKVSPNDMSAIAEGNRIAFSRQFTKKLTG